jgi:hypothetical protein
LESYWKKNLNLAVSSIIYDSSLSLSFVVLLGPKRRSEEEEVESKKNTA